MVIEGYILLVMDCRDVENNIPAIFLYSGRVFLSLFGINVENP
jgi:hypothetical protein